MAEPVFLGGSAAPIGSTIAFIEAPLRTVHSELTSSRQRVAKDGVTIETSDVLPLAEALVWLDPMQAPWTTEVLVGCDFGTAYLNNGLGGGDPTAGAPALARGLDARLVTAMHIAPYGPGHAATQLWLHGPGGEPPLMDVRTIAATATDGRWQWHEEGEVQPWEQSDRYSARVTRTRLDRPLLVTYLAALGIRVDEPDFFHEARAVRQLVPWRVRSQSAAQFRATNRLQGLPPAGG